MNNQEFESQRKEEVDVTKRRRFLKGAGVAAPVLLTFTSPTAFGGTALCMSQQLSGTVSHPTLSCDIGTYNSSNIADPSFPSINGYDALTTFDSVFGVGSSTETFGALVAADPRSREAIYVTAFMNAQASTTYVIMPAQVTGLFNGTIAYPPLYGSDIDFIVSTFP